MSTIRFEGHVPVALAGGVVTCGAVLVAMATAEIVPAWVASRRSSAC